MLYNYFYRKLQEKISRGIIVIDKESGITSHDEIARLRSIFGTKKIGHSGTLDPKVTGLLVCGLGRGTRVLEYVLLGKKTYSGDIIFHHPVSRERFEQTVREFTGAIQQLPPVKSRVKRVERTREVYSIDIVDFALDQRSARIVCAVERGTYIRKLCHDMGVHLGSGAHMGDLHRTHVGDFNYHNSRPVTTAELGEIYKQSTSAVWGWWYLWRLTRYIYPIERMFTRTPRVVVDERITQPIASGADIFIPGVLAVDPALAGDMVQVVTPAGRVLAIGRICLDSDRLPCSEKGVAVAIDKVLCG